MTLLIRDLLDEARLGRSAQEPERVALDEVIGEALEHLQERIRERGAQVQVGPMPSVTGRRLQLIRLFQNLVGNAVKYCAPDRAPTVRIDAQRRDDGRWLVSVEDNGIGIAAGDREAVFEAFHRLPPAGTYEGTGLGLASCRTIVERHGGRIWVEDAPGCGALLRFTLPG